MFLGSKLGFKDLNPFLPFVFLLLFYHYFFAGNVKRLRDLPSRVLYLVILRSRDKLFVLTRKELILLSSEDTKNVSGIFFMYRKAGKRGNAWLINMVHFCVHIYMYT